MLRGPLFFADYLTMVPSGSGRLALLLAALLALNALTMFYSVVSFLPPRVVIEGNANWSDYSTGTWPIQRVAAPSFDKCSGTVFMPNPPWAPSCIAALMPPV